MTIGLLFWILMILWLVLGAVPYFGPGPKNWPTIGGSFLGWCCLALVGWKVFGPAIHG